MKIGEMNANLLKQLRHKKITKDIKSSSAKVVLAAAMKDAGLKYRYSGQTHRVKLSVLITKDRCLTVYLAYSKLNDQLPHVIRSLKNIKHELDTHGNAFTISKAPGAGAW